MLKDLTITQSSLLSGPDDSHGSHADPDDVRSYIESFLLEQRVRGNSHNTVRFYKGNLMRFVQFLEQEQYPTNIYQLRPAHFRHFFVFLSESTHRWGSDAPAANRKLSPGGVQVFARAVRALMRFVTVEANLQKSPMANVSMPSGRTDWKVQTFSDDEIVLLFKAIEKISRTDFIRLRNRAMLATLLDSGLRASELLSMTIETNWQAGMFEVLGKGSKIRQVAIGEFAMRELSSYARARQRVSTRSTALFLTRSGEAAEYWTLREYFRDLRLATKIDHCHPHCCRATALSRMLKSGMPLVYIKQLAGHASLVTTERFYLATASDDIKAEHQKYGPLDNMGSALKHVRSAASTAEGGRTALQLPSALELLRQLREGTSYRELARQYGCTDTTIRNRLKAAGVVPGRTG